MLENTTVLVTGASRGLGAAIAKAAHRSGARVVINYYQSAQAAHQLADNLGARAIAIQADIREQAQVNEMVRQASEWAKGPVQALVNNALVDYRFNGDGRTPLPALGWTALHNQLEGSVRASLHTIQACQPGMAAGGGGAIVNIGTNLFQHPVVPYHDYTVAKGALLALTRTAAKELGGQGIRVNMVSGGLLRTTDASAATPPEVFDYIASQTPLGHVTTPEEMADAVLLMLSPLARGVTGQNIVVDGGLVMN